MYKNRYEHRVRKQGGVCTSLIGAMKSSEGILVFTDKRNMINEKRGEYKDLKVGKIFKLHSQENVIILHAGDRDIFDNLSSLISIEKFDDTEIRDVVGMLNREFLKMSGTKELFYDFLLENRIYLIMVGYDENNKSKIIRIAYAGGLGGFSFSYKTDEGFDIISPINESYIKLNELYKFNLPFIELEQKAQEVYDYTKELTTFVGGGIEIKKLYLPKIRR